MITIVDYGLGNIKAFANVYKRLNIDVAYASNVEDLNRASKIILPGVGAFDHAMNMLNDSGLRDCLDKLVLDEKVPVIGICVGMQMMAHKSEEGSVGGLGWINGQVKQFAYADEESSHEHPLPHMGWNEILPVRDCALLNNLDSERRMYFLHSYYFESTNSEGVVANANYGFDYPCIINNENVYGIQCHPEKSHHNGVTILKNFSEL